MKKLLFFVLILAFLGGTASTYAQQYRQDYRDQGYGQGFDGQGANNFGGGQHPRDGACFYTTAPFQGHRFCMSAGQRMPDLQGHFNNNISSIVIYGNARVRIFNDSNYSDGSAEVWETVRDLRNLPFRGGHTWNNRISSIMVSFGGGRGSRYGQPYGQGNQDRGYGRRYDQQGANNFGGGQHPRDGACFYTTAPFQGHRFCMSAGQRMPNLQGHFNNNISSIVIYGNARVRIFNDSNYSNGSSEVWETVRDLRNLPFRGGHTWNNRISSIMVSFGGGRGSRYGQPYGQNYRDQGYGPGYDQQGANNFGGGQHPRDGACFYTTAPFQGHRFCMSAGQRMPDLQGHFNNNISSIVVYGNAQVRIFNDSNYSNGSAEVWQTVRDLRNLPFRGGHTWNNRISSVMVR